MKVTIGTSTIMGYGVALLGLIPLVVKLIEEGTVASAHLNGLDEVSALISIVTLGITQIGRYVQAAILAKGQRK